MGRVTLTKEDLRHRFTYHPPVGDYQVQTYQVLRDQAYDLAEQILFSVPDCRERSLAFTKLEEAIMWANAGLARNYVPPGSVPEPGQSGDDRR